MHPIPPLPISVNQRRPTQATIPSGAVFGVGSRNALTTGVEGNENPLLASNQEKNAQESARQQGCAVSIVQADPFRAGQGSLIPLHTSKTLGSTCFFD